jgi:hypothetical protein
MCGFDHRQQVAAEFVLLAGLCVHFGEDRE